jgi:hypothetical protein
MSDTLSGVLHRVKFRSKEPGNDYVIATLVTGETVKGDAPDSEFIVGSSYSFEGTWKLGREWQGKREKEFCFTKLTRSESHSRTGLVHYLEKFCPGIGPTLSNRIFDEFGQDAVKALRTSPDEVSSRVKGLTPEIAEVASKELQKNVKHEEARIALNQLLDGRGFSRNLASQCLKKWGILAPTRIRRDPFCLLVAGFPSAGFARCDRMYLELGKNPGRLKRLMLSTWYQIRESMEGHTWFPAKQVLEKLRRDAATGLDDVSQHSMQSADQRVLKAIRLGVRAGWLAIRKTSGGIFIAEGQQAANEGVIAQHIGRILTTQHEPAPAEVLLALTSAHGEELDRRRNENQEIDELTVEQKAEIGRQIGICQFCSRVLTNPESRLRGYGPTCAENHGLPWGGLMVPATDESGVSESMLEAVPL